MSSVAALQRRERTATRIGGWAFVAVAVGHVTVATFMPSSGDALVVERQMHQATFPFPPSHSYADLMKGFSLAMSILLIAWGVSVLLATRGGRTAESAQVALCFGVSLALLVTSVLLLPAPPIVAMSVASAAFATALDASLRRSALMKKASPRGVPQATVSS